MILVEGVSLDSYTENIPLQRMAEPIEVSRLFLFLVSVESSFSRGADRMIDGGASARETGQTNGLDNQTFFIF